MRTEPSKWIGGGYRSVLRPLSLALAAFLLGSPTAPCQADRHGAGPSGALSIEPGVSFVENRGQWHGDVHFRARSGAVWMWVESSGLTLATLRPPAVAAERVRPRPDGAFDREQRLDVTVVKLRFQGGAAVPVGESPQPGVRSYFLGNDPGGWASAVPAFDRVRWPEVWPGVDFVVRAADGVFEYDLELRPGADLGQVELRVEGGDGALRIAADGSLCVATGAGELRQTAPRALRGTRRARVQVDSAFELRAPDRFGFRVTAHDREQPLLIDPGFLWGTYLGGSDLDEPYGLYVYPDGQAVVSGWSASLGFPTTAGAYQTALAGTWDAFATQLDPRLTGTAQLVWSTRVGGRTTISGQGGDSCFAMDVSPLGVITLVGSTECTDFPIFSSTTAVQASYRGGSTDGFVACLNTSGTRLVYSTYVGGGFSDALWGVHLSDQGTMSVAGTTASTDYPTSASAQARFFRGGQSDAVFTRFDTGSGALVYSTYLGGDGDDRGLGLSVTQNGVAAVAGEVGPWQSQPFPLRNPVQAVHGGGSTDAFVTVFNGVSSILHSTVVGGAGADGAAGVWIDAIDRVTFCGATTGGFPVTNGAFQTTYGGGSADAFVARLPAGGGQLDYSTYLGGPARDAANSVRVSADEATVAGEAQIGFPTTKGAVQAITDLAGDGFVCRLTMSAAVPAASQLGYSTGFGGTAGVVSSRDWAQAAFTAPDGIITATGGTFALNVPTQNPWQALHAGQSDLWVARMLSAPGYVVFGQGCAGTAGVPGIRQQNLPRVGQAFSVILQNLRPGQPALVFTGISKRFAGPLPLPFDLGVIGMPGCSLLASTEISASFTPTSTPMSWGFTVPNNPVLFAARFHNQLLVVDPGVNAVGAVLSPGAEAVVGR